MKIKLSSVLDVIAQEGGIKKKDITIRAWYEEMDVELGDYSTDIKKEILLDAFDKLYPSQKNLSVVVYAKRCKILKFIAKGVNPADNEIYKYMGIGGVQHCIGPGFYYSEPCFEVFPAFEPWTGGGDYQKFIDAVVLDTEQVEVIDTPQILKNCIDNRYNNDVKKILSSLENTSLRKTFFKKLPEIIETKGYFSKQKTNKKEKVLN